MATVGGRQGLTEQAGWLNDGLLNSQLSVGEMYGLLQHRVSIDQPVGTDLGGGDTGLPSSCSALWVCNSELISTAAALSSLVSSLGEFVDPESIVDSSSLSPSAAKSSPFSMEFGATTWLMEILFSDNKQCNIHSLI